jgi:hypothetical protein
MTASDCEIVLYILDLVHHGRNCGLVRCSSCDKLCEIVDVVRDMIFDTDPALDVSEAAISLAHTPTT